MRRVLLLINPQARRGAGARAQAVQALKGLGHSVIETSEENPANFPELVRRFADKVDIVAVGGGDGTIRTVVPALLETTLLLAILPLGTANNLARNLGIPADVTQACAVLRSGTHRWIDLASVNDQYFINVAGLGLSSEINRGVPAELKRRWGALAYGIYGLRLLRRAKPFRAAVLADGRELHLKALQITVCNGRHFGAGLTISPDASISDARLDLCSTHLSSLWQAIPILLAMRKGEQKRFTNVVLLHSTAFEIRTTRPIGIDTDGEVTTRTPATFRVLPQALQVIAPAP